MYLLIDAGNTNCVFALCAGEQIAHSWRIRTDSGRTRDEYASWLIPLFARAGVSYLDVRGALVSSVVPDANHHLRGLCRAYFNLDARFVGHETPVPDLRVDIDRPEDVGADRLVNALAVRRHYRSPAIVIDFGTATTFDVLGDSGAYIGGVIAPGVNLSMTALHKAAAMLPKVSVRKPPAVIGRRTVTAMQSGIFWGYVGLVEGMIMRITEELPASPFVIATGGLAPLFSEHIPLIETLDRDLPLKGLLAMAQESL